MSKWHLRFEHPLGAIQKMVRGHPKKWLGAIQKMMSASDIKSPNSSPLPVSHPPRMAQYFKFLTPPTDITPWSHTLGCKPRPSILEHQHFHGNVDRVPCWSIQCPSSRKWPRFPAWWPRRPRETPIPHRFANRHKVRHHSLLLKGPVMRADPAEARLHFIRQAETAGRTDRPEKTFYQPAKISHQKHGRKRYRIVQTTKNTAENGMELFERTHRPVWDSHPAGKLGPRSSAVTRPKRGPHLSRSGLSGRWFWWLPPRRAGSTRRPNNRDFGTSRDKHLPVERTSGMKTTAPHEIPRGRDPHSPRPEASF